MPGEFHEGVGVAPIPRSIVVASGLSCERIEHSTESCSTDRVEEPLDEDRATLSSPHFQRPIFDVLPLLGLERLGVVRVAHVSAVSPEPTQAVAHGLVKERLLLEGGRCRGRLERPRSPGHQRQMSKSEPSPLDGRNALRKSSRL